MSKAKAKIWARLIYKGEKSIEDVAEEHRDMVREAYLEIYGEPLPEAGAETDEEAGNE